MKRNFLSIILAAVLALSALLSACGSNQPSERSGADSSGGRAFGADSSGSNAFGADSSASKAPDFTVLAMDGSSVNLSDFVGKPVVINFWATWCGPCKSELPAFNKAHQQFGDDAVFMMVDMTDGYQDSVASVKEFVSKSGYDFPVYFDTQSSASDAYEIMSIPLTVMVDSDGNIFKSQVGAMDEATLFESIEALIGGAQQ